MNEGTHFFPNHAPRKLGWKVLAANISDISAMGGAPKYALLSLSYISSNVFYFFMLLLSVPSVCLYVDGNFFGDIPILPKR